MTDTKAELLALAERATVAKLLRAIANAENAKLWKHDIIFNKAADLIEDDALRTAAQPRPVMGTSAVNQAQPSMALGDDCICCHRPLNAGGRCLQCEPLSAPTPPIEPETSGGEEINHFEKHRGQFIDWKMEAKRANRLYAKAEEENVALRRERDEARSNANKWQRERTMLFDALHSTPCEQIRHQQQVEELQVQLATVREATIEECAKVADGMAARQQLFVYLNPEHAPAYDTWRSAVRDYKEAAAAIRSLAVPK